MSKCQPQCDSHLFTLKGLNTRCWMKQDTHINYCPSFNDDYRQMRNIVPIFNNDQEPSLPGFILDYDKVRKFYQTYYQYQYQINHEKYKDDHRRKIVEYTTKKRELLEPRPNKRHRYCGVCRQNYEEYREHLLGKDHIDYFKRSKYVFLIEKMIKQNKNTSGTIDESNQSTIQMPQTLSLLIRDTLQGKKKRGRPNLTDQQKLENKQEREQRKKQGLEPPIKKKAKQEIQDNKDLFRKVEQLIKADDEPKFSFIYN